METVTKSKKISRGNGFYIEHVKPSGLKWKEGYFISKHGIVKVHCQKEPEDDLYTVYMEFAYNGTLYTQEIQKVRNIEDMSLSIRAGKLVKSIFCT